MTKQNQSEITHSLVTTIEQFHELKNPWHKLMEESETFSFFLTWEWLYTWWEVYHGEKTRLMILVFSYNDLIVGIAPFYVEGKKNKKILRFIGTGEPEWEEVSSMYLDIICKKDYEKSVSKSVWHYLRDQKDMWDEALFCDIIQPSNIVDNILLQVQESNFNHFRKEVGTRFYIEMPDTWEKYVAPLSKNRRKKIRWNLNRLGSLGDVNEYAVDSAQDLENAFNNLVRLHTLRWENQGEEGVFASQRFLNFHRKLLERIFPLNRFDLRMISINGEIVSTLYNFRYNTNIFTYQAGFQLGENFSLGFAADILSIQAAIKSGCQTYDYMKGNEDSYKGSFRCIRTAMYDLTVYNRNMSGQLGYFFEQAKAVARPIKKLISST